MIYLAEAWTQYAKYVITVAIIVQVLEKINVNLVFKNLKIIEHKILHQANVLAKVDGMMSKQIYFVSNAI